MGEKWPRKNYFEISSCIIFFSYFIKEKIFAQKFKLSNKVLMRKNSSIRCQISMNYRISFSAPWFTIMKYPVIVSTLLQMFCRKISNKLQQNS